VSDQSDWLLPGAYPVTDGIHRLPLPLPMDGLRAVNVYTVETEEGLTLIDGGWAIDESRSQLDQGLASLGHTVADINRFLVTHMHRDHYTQAVTVRRELGAHVSLGIGEKPSLDIIGDPLHGGDTTAAQLRLAGAASIAAKWARAAERAPKPDPTWWEYPDTWLEGDHRLTVGTRVIDAVSTPGHTQGHFVFADRSAGLLFAGDHILPTITPSIGFEAAYAAQPLGDFLASLAKVRAMPDLQLLPAHGAVTSSTHERIDELVAHHATRLSQCLQAIHGGLHTAYDVAAKLPWTRHGRLLKELDVFNAALASMETMAHLQLLTAQGKASRTEEDGVYLYAL